MKGDNIDVNFSKKQKQGYYFLNICFYYRVTPFFVARIITKNGMIRENQ